MQRSVQRTQTVKWFFGAEMHVITDQFSAWQSKGVGRVCVSVWILNND